MTSPAGARGKALEYRPAESDTQRLANLCGPLDAHLRQIAEAFDTRIQRRGEQFLIEGAPAAARAAREALAHFHGLAQRALSIDEIQLGLVELRAGARPAAASASPAAVASEEADTPVLHTRRADLQGRTPRQREYLRHILSHDITFGIGPAGTGKTYLAVACAVDALERDAVKRIVLTRPAVEAGERLGFLPGDLAQKVDPYLRPLYDALYDLLGFERTARMFEKQAIEIAPLAYMRGRTLNHAFIILDEAQNTTPEQMKMFLTRIGFGSRAVVTGDTTQVDLPRGQACGLVEAVSVLREVRGIAFTRFDSSDVVRHPLVARIVDAYERAGSKG
ncbi:MAG: PhoH family protein [Betaproteobacteria bacterium]|nr:PhoH family protein [Betaproteobacteria bacterium]